MYKKKIFWLIPVLLLGIAFTGPFNNKFFEIAKNIEIYSNVYKEINTHYVDDLDPAKMMKIGVDAMLDALDPYTKYISEAEIENYRLSTEGKYEGVGARIVSMGDRIVVTDIYKDSPADKAGLKIADEVIAVNGQSAEGRNGREAMQFLRGAPGTAVSMTVRRPGESSPQKLNIVRAQIERPSVPYSGMTGGDIAYVSLNSFTPACGNDVLQAFKKLDADHEVNGFILDLRGNGGGLLHEAVNVCNIFIPKDKLVVSTRAKVDSRNQNYNTRVEPWDTTRPLVILIDKNSASASEIVSGTIQDYDRGVLMGQLTFGKGLVQNTREVGYNSQLKITTSKYYIPSGRCIQAVEYENGEPVRLPDSLRAQFKTQNGRIVLDGGGVKPDIELEDLDDNELLRFLDKGGVLFDFVTQYLMTNQVTSWDLTSTFTDFAAFEAFFEQMRGSYTSSLEKSLGELRKKLEEEGTADSFRSDLESLNSKLKEKERQELLEHKETILRLIASEIVARIELDEGRSEYVLQSDPEVAQAVEVLHTDAQYRKVLKKQG